MNLLDIITKIAVVGLSFCLLAAIVFYSFGGLNSGVDSNSVNDTTVHEAERVNENEFHTEVGRELKNNTEVPNSIVGTDISRAAEETNNDIDESDSDEDLLDVVTPKNEDQVQSVEQDSDVSESYKLFKLTLIDSAADKVINRGDKIGYQLNDQQNDFGREEDGLLSGTGRWSIVSVDTGTEKILLDYGGTLARSLTLDVYPYTDPNDFCTERDNAWLFAMSHQLESNSIAEVLQRCTDNPGIREGYRFGASVESGLYYLQLEIVDSNGKLVAVGESEQFRIID